MVPELKQRIGQGVFGRPPGAAEQVRRTPRPQGDQPKSAVDGPPEHGIDGAQGAKGMPHISSAHGRDVTPQQYDPPEPGQRPRHPDPQVTTPLWNGPKSPDRRP